MNCEKCGEPLHRNGGIFRTLVGYGGFDAPHNHDDNCQTCMYTCANGHNVTLSVRRTCPVCDWKGKETCFCHPGKKLDRWPNMQQGSASESTK